MMGFFMENKRYLIAIAAELVMAVIVGVVREIWKAEGVAGVLADLSDAFFVPGIVMLGIGVLIFAVNQGIFNGVAFGFKTIGRTLFASKNEKILEESFYEYNTRMKEKKIEYKYLLLVGAVFAVIGILFSVIYVFI